MSGRGIMGKKNDENYEPNNRNNTDYIWFVYRSKSNIHPDYSLIKNQF